MKKFSQLDFEMWGRQVATDYLENNTPMNDSIIKIARDNQLNHEHVRRVVEEANNLTYLKKFGAEKTEDKYIEFDVADARVIAKVLNAPEKTAGLQNDYIFSPKEHEYYAGDDRFVKTIKQVPEEPSEAEKNAMVYTAMGIHEQFENKMNRLTRRFDEKVAELKYLYKTAQEPNANVLTQALEQYVKQKYEPNGLQTKLASQILYDVKIDKGEKLAAVPPILNEEHPVLSTFREAIKVASEYSDAYNTGPDLSPLEDRGARNEKTAALSSKVASALWKALVAAGLIGTTAAAAHKAGYEKGKKIQAIKMSPLKQLPKTHDPRGR